MGSRLVIALVVVVAALAAAAVVERRRPAAPPRTAWPIPAQLDRADFARPEAPWLVVLFSSATCHTCVDMAARVAALESADVATMDVEAAARRDLHERYRIEAAPMVVVADAEGVVRAGFTGAVSAGDLAAAVDRARGAAD